MIVIHLNYGFTNGKYVHLIRTPDGAGKIINARQLKRLYDSGLPWRYAQ
jgi:hypothetical protein